MARIRRLRYGESPPAGEPGRYKSEHGYVRLRWRVGPNESVEIYEHRWVTGAQPGEQVHHVNGVKDDNRPENLRVLSPREHRHEYAVFDVEEMERLYRSGVNTPEIAKRLGCHSSVVYRKLVSRGVPIRSVTESLELDLPENEIRLLHQAGVRSRQIALHYGVSSGVIDRRIFLMGLRPHRTGRPSDADRHRQEAVLRQVAS